MSSLTRPPQWVIGIGASAGGINALIEVLSALPAGLPHAICVTQHIPATSESLLPQILNRHCELTVTVARQDARLTAGCVFVAPPDHHLVVHDGRVELTRGPKENAVRPSVDTMLRSIAACAPRCAAVVLSGALGDGSDGAAVVLHAGGAVFVQDPDEAIVRSMPDRTIALVDGGATVLPAAEIGAALAALDGGAEEEVDVELPSKDVPPEETRPPGPASGFTCPECNGAIWEMDDGSVRRYRCRVGHVYSEDAMLDEQGSAVEAALWAALEVLEERAELLRRVAERRSRHTGLRERFRAAAAEADARATLIRRALDAGGDTLGAEASGG